MNVRYHPGCVELDIEPYKWFVQLCEGLDKQEEESTDVDDVLISLYRYVPDYIVGLVQPKQKFDPSRSYF